MGTRSGSIDPGAVIYMMRELGMGAEAIERCLNLDCGLAGLSEATNDVRALLKTHDARARLALDHFALKVAQHAAMMAVSLGGVDALVFTGGIGENAGPVRDRIAAQLSFLGAFPRLAIPANEERIIAMHMLKELCG
jgi:acetate kinase